MKQKNVRRKKRKLNLRKVFFCLLILFFICVSIKKVTTLPIKNIYIENNEIISDQQIIEIAKINNYPPAFKSLSIMVKKRLLKNDYILDAQVYKKGFNQVYISVEENYPMFINRINNKTILYDGKEVEQKFTVPTLINVVPDTKYKSFVEKIRIVDQCILQRISEIEYAPNDVESNRFLFYMNDGNYVYITLDKFSSINSYLDIIKKFENKKGILHLDYGNHFTIIDN